MKAFFDANIYERANPPSSRSPDADPGPSGQRQLWVPALRSSVKDAAPRPGHEWNMLSPPF